MSATQQVEEDDVASMLEQVENQLQSRLVGRIYNFRLLSRDRGLILQGRAGSYHDKQLAQQIVMHSTTLPILANDIEVSYQGVLLRTVNEALKLVNRLRK